ncbi:MAG: hypothetical protein ABF802_10795 [Acetobacter orientalis]|jgi:hypothetical protein|uniref:hypothetical protein n=2 Tax=Acetobacteraceae TaxID=433 RepID=UPI001F258620|nr:hypothetical protein [Acetobacter persici]MCG0999217.1 hypothetical protein [Acetobacter persici]
MSVFYTNLLVRKIDMEFIAVGARKKNVITSSDWAESTIRSEPDEVDAFLASIDASRNQFLLAGQRALHAKTNATPFHAKNAKGTFVFHEAIPQLRFLFVGENWTPRTINGVEYIENKDKKIRIAYSSVDVCGLREVSPKPCSEKGAGVERALNGGLFSNLPTYTKEEDVIKKSEYTIYYALMDDKGNMELSRPVVSNKTFSSYPERNFLGSCEDGVEENYNLEGDTVSDFDPQVTRK